MVNLFLWLRRIRHRCGHGIHSPWVFRLVTDVIYQTDAYYAYDKQPTIEGWRPKDVRLLFRLINHFQPHTLEWYSPVPAEAGTDEWFSKACRHTVLKFYVSEHSHIILQREDGADCFITTGCKGELWNSLRKQGVALDLHYIGLVYTGLNIPNQLHIINYT